MAYTRLIRTAARGGIKYVTHIERELQRNDLDLPAASWTMAVILIHSCCLWWWRTKATATEAAAQARSITQPPPQRTRVTCIKDKT